VRRREFLVVVARMGALASLTTVYPLRALPAPDAADALWKPTGQLISGYPVDVRVLDPTGPLTDWFTVTNDTQELIIRRLRRCWITGIEYRVDIGEPWQSSYELRVPTQITDEQPVLLTWGERGLITYD
jgi:hypothetical protein